MHYRMYNLGIMYKKANSFRDSLSNEMDQICNFTKLGFVQFKTNFCIIIRK